MADRYLVETGAGPQTLVASTPAANGLGGSGTTVAVALGAADLLNDTIVVGVTLRSGDGFTCTGVADSDGNVYQQRKVYDDQIDTGRILYLFIARVTTAGTPTITATFDGAALGRTIHVAAFRTTLDGNPVDQEATGSGASGTSITSGSMTPAEDKEVVWGFAASLVEVPAVAGVFASLASEATVQTRTEYEIQTTATARTTNFTTGASGAWATIGVTLKAAPSGTGVDGYLLEDGSGVLILEQQPVAGVAPPWWAGDEVAPLYLRTVVMPQLQRPLVPVGAPAALVPVPQLVAAYLRVATPVQIRTLPLPQDVVAPTPALVPPVQLVAPYLPAPFTAPGRPSRRTEEPVAPEVALPPLPLSELVACYLRGVIGPQLRPFRAIEEAPPDVPVPLPVWLAGRYVAAYFGPAVIQVPRVRSGQVTEPAATAPGDLDNRQWQESGPQWTNFLR